MALRQIIDGHLDVPVLMMKFYLDYAPQDTESHFILALACAQRPVQAALDLGLPAERFIAGPRRLIPPLFDHYPDLRLQLLSRLEAVSCTG